MKVGAAVSLEHPIAGGEQGFPPRVLRIGEGPLGVDAELGHPLVLLAQGLEEGLRVAGMNEHGQTEAPGRRPHRVEATVVHREVAALVARVGHPQAQGLRDLQTACAHLGGALQPGHLPRGEVRAVVVAPAEIDTDEDAGSVDIGRVERRLQRVAARTPGQVDEAADAVGGQEVERQRVAVRAGVHVHVDHRRTRQRSARCRAQADEDCQCRAHRRNSGLGERFGARVAPPSSSDILP